MTVESRRASPPQPPPALVAAFAAESPHPLLSSEDLAQIAWDALLNEGELTNYESSGIGRGILTRWSNLPPRQRVLVIPVTEAGVGVADRTHDA